MKVYSSTYDLDYSWNEVSTGNWRKYCPWNKESSHVIAVDTLSRRVDSDSGVLRTERLITCKQAAPKWVKPFLGSAEVSHVYEISYVRPPFLPPNSPASRSSSISSPSSSSSSIMSSRPSLSNTLRRPSVASSTGPIPQNPSVTMISHNLTWSDLIAVHETVVYTPSTVDSAGKTQFRQQANITALCGGWAKVREKIEGFTVERFRQNAERGKAGFEEVLQMSRRVFGEEREKEKNKMRA